MKVKKAVVNYRHFRLNKLNQPEYSHLRLLMAWPLYFAAYFLTENLIPASVCTPIHCALDDLIPFCEIFVIPYVLWYALVAGSLLYFALYNVESFTKLMKFIIVTMVCAMVIYVLFPNRQDLRPAEFPRDNLLSRLVGLLYAFDTNTNVCPSLHVAYSVGIAFVWVQEKGVPPIVKSLIVIFAILVCLSTAFIKQHSVLDGLAAIPVCIAAAIISSLPLKFPK